MSTADYPRYTAESPAAEDAVIKSLNRVCSADVATFKARAVACITLFFVLHTTESPTAEMVPSTDPIWTVPPSPLTTLYSPGPRFAIRHVW